MGDIQSAQTLIYLFETHLAHVSLKMLFFRALLKLIHSLNSLFHIVFVILSFMCDSSVCVSSEWRMFVMFFQWLWNLLVDTYSLQILFRKRVESLNCLHLTTAICHFGIYCSNCIWLSVFIPIAFQSSGQRQKEHFFIPFCMPTYSLTEALFVIRLLLLSAKLLVVFPSEAPNHHMLVFASEKLKPLCPYWERSIIDIVNFIWNM